MRTWHLIGTFTGILLAVVALSFATAGRANAAPLLQVAGPQQATVGLFGTISAIVTTTAATSTIILDGGEVVATNASTTFIVPDVDAATLADITVGDRVAILAIEDGGLVALDVSVIPDEPVSTVHVLGVVTESGDGLITLTDSQGNTTTVALPEGTIVNLGDFLTVVSSGPTSLK